MPALREAQEHTLAALLHGAPPPAGLLRDGPGLRAAQRLQVYRNNVRENLTDALAAVYPVVERLVGSGCFRQAARGYIHEHPPRSGALLDFGAGFARHLRRTVALPYLPGVAALEWACHRACHSAEDAALDPRALAALDAAAQATLRLRLQPGARLVASRYPLLAIWQANQPGADPDAPAVSLDDGGVRLLVVPQDLDLAFHRLGAAEFRLLRALARRRSLPEATAAALDADPSFDLGATLGRHFAAGLYTGWSCGG